jgi:hypothetical protein
MMDRSKWKLEILNVLREWDYNKEKASPWAIAKKLNCSISTVQVILRYMDGLDLAHSHKGSWALV